MTKEMDKYPSMRNRLSKRRKQLQIPKDNKGKRSSKRTLTNKLRKLMEDHQIILLHPRRNVIQLMKMKSVPQERELVEQLEMSQ